MATKFSEVYALFYGQIDDYELGSLSREDLALVADKYLVNSLLTIQDTVTDIFDIDIEDKQFNSTLEYPELMLLAKAMKLEWVKEKKYSEELMRKSIGDRDYKAVQGYSYLAHLGDVEKHLEKEIKNQLIRLSYRASIRGRSLI